MDDHEREKLLKTFREKPDLLVDFIATGTESIQAKVEAESTRTIAWLEEQRSIGKMRWIWSRWLLFSIVAIVFFDFLFIFLLGRNILRFQEQNVVFAFIVENLIKIGGLATIVVGFLFDRSSTK